MTRFDRTEHRLDRLAARAERRAERRAARRDGRLKALLASGIYVVILICLVAVVRWLFFPEGF